MHQRPSRGPETGAQQVLQELPGPELQGRQGGSGEEDPAVHAHQDLPGFQGLRRGRLRIPQTEEEEAINDGENSSEKLTNLVKGFSIFSNLIGQQLKVTLD